VKLILSETDLMYQILDLAHVRGWLAQHTRPAWTAKGWRTPIQGDKGFPDLVLARAPRVIIAELKDDRAQLSKEQKLWVERLSDCRGVEVYVWRPRDWAEIEVVLL